VPAVTPPPRTPPPLLSFPFLHRGVEEIAWARCIPGGGRLSTLPPLSPYEEGKANGRLSFLPPPLFPLFFFSSRIAGVNNDKERHHAWWS